MYSNAPAAATDGVERQRSLLRRCATESGQYLGFAPEELERSLVARFETVAAQQPDAPAIVAPAGQLTYRQLCHAARVVAGELLQCSGRTAQPVVVLSRPGLGGAVGTLAVLRSGNIVVPLDPHDPVERLRLIVAETEPTVVLYEPELHALALELTPDGCLSLPIKVAGGNTPAPQTFPETSPDALSTICFSSGSTGRPKGVPRTHRAQLHASLTFGELLRISAADRWSGFHAFSFGSSVFDLWAALLNGAALCCWDVRTRGLAELDRWVNESGVTVLSWVPSAFRGFSRSTSEAMCFPGVRLALFGSEQFATRDALEFMQRFDADCIFVNRLASTEALHYRVFVFDRHTVWHGPSVPAGYEMTDKLVALEDDAGGETPLGQAGEIVVRSPYLSPGYWRDPELTRQKFRPPLDADQPTAYRTGDLGRLLADGCLIYLGRKDGQVKIRGQRVEPAEIEAALASLEDIRECAVVTATDPSDERFLAAYYVPLNSAPIDEAGLRRRLGALLPGYMIPKVFVCLKELPRTPFHKVDVAALPPLTVGLTLPTAGYRPAQNGLQLRLVAVWQDILKLQPVGVDDDYFALGGDSLQALQLVNRLQSWLGVPLQIPPLFDAPTIAEYASYLQTQFADAVERVAAAERLPSPPAARDDRSAAIEPRPLRLLAGPPAEFAVTAQVQRRPNATRR